ncbi:MAG: efflux RND transporter periplasmic adaptor subunit, partial [Acidobacteriota bacterium]
LGVERVFSGEVEAATRSRVSFRVSGRVVDRPVEIGDRLVAGATVATLDATDLRLRVERADASLDRARAAAREAEAAYERARLLFADDHLTRADLDRALAALESTRGAVAEAERGADLARRELGFARLGAPTTGTVSAVFAEPGENVTVGQPVIDLVADGAPLEIAWAMPERWIGGVREGATVTVTFPALDDVRLDATVSDIGSAPSTGRATYPVRARFAATDERLRAGMTVDVGIRLGEADVSTVVVPPHAVAADPRGRYVYVLDEATAADGDDERRTVRRREVTVGRLLDDGLEVLDGLAVGDTVVAAGVDFIDDGQTVRLLRGDPLGELPSTRLGAEAGR